jgi:2-polyprenyl-6-methoxyphenol hydroxylase-like FAD-dependent oxidoreductase
MGAQTQFKIIVIGGGIAGFAASVGLARKGHDVTVLERSKDLQTFGGGLLISSNALRVIEDYAYVRSSLLHEIILQLFEEVIL